MTLALYFIDRGDGQSMLGTPLPPWWSRRKREWLRLEKQNGWWVVTATADHKLTSLGNDRIVRDI